MSWKMLCFRAVGSSQLAFQRKQFPREDGQAEITSKEVPGESSGEGMGIAQCLPFPGYFHCPRDVESCDGKEARAAG